jgi:Asp-tRNA(Asn)/Glu-tRNA(Gln) amidotransferase C subunit
VAPPAHGIVNFKTSTAVAGAARVKSIYLRYFSTWSFGAARVLHESRSTLRILFAMGRRDRGEIITPMSEFDAVDWTAMSRSAQDLERLSTQYAGIMALAKTVAKIASIEATARATEQRLAKLRQDEATAMSRVAAITSSIERMERDRIAIESAISAGRATVTRLDVEIDQKQAMVTAHEKRLLDLQRTVAEAEALQTRRRDG